MTKQVALIGYGAIARAVIQALIGDDQVRVSQILVRPERCGEVQSALPEGTTAISKIDALNSNTDFVLECAGHDAVWHFGAKVLERGVDLGILSAGALARPDVLARVREASQTGHARLIVLPGAIGGIDALAAAGDSLERVSYTARKPPLSWTGSPADATYNLAQIDSETAIFKGSARDAALQFPKNANVVATVALAGIGFEQTDVTLLADPKATGNSHQITASGPLFDFAFTTAGKALPDNPKTSALTALSAIRALRHRGTGLLV